MAYKRKLLLDLDGVLHDYHGWNDGKFGEPLPKARHACLLLSTQFELVCFTSREDQAAVTAWLAKYGFPKMRVTNLKEPAYLQIDDRAMLFTGVWDDAFLEKIREFRPHWKPEEATDAERELLASEMQKSLDVL